MILTLNSVPVLRVLRLHGAICLRPHPTDTTWTAAALTDITMDGPPASSSRGVQAPALTLVFGDKALRTMPRCRTDSFMLCFARVCFSAFLFGGFCACVPMVFGEHE
jgi:hypothetical protein